MQNRGPVSQATLLPALCDIPPLPALPAVCARMRSNEALRIHGFCVDLVPYRRQHVATYHAWMQRDELLDSTASERLTLEEEYENCRSWHEDEGKCTFILLAAERMVGDVNLFLGVDDDPSAAEIEVMVAEPGARRSGCAVEALTLLQTWAWGRLGVRRFVAKIGCSNAASLQLFRKLGYTHASTSQVFQEETLELVLQGGDSEREAALDGLRTSAVTDDDPLGVPASVV